MHEGIFLNSGIPKLLCDLDKEYTQEYSTCSKVQHGATHCSLAKEIEITTSHIYLYLP